MVDVTVLQAQITAAQAALTSVLAAPGPDYTISGPEGSRSIAKATYIRQLTATIGDLQKLLIEVSPYRVQTKHIIS